MASSYFKKYLSFFIGILFLVLNCVSVYSAPLPLLTRRGALPTIGPQHFIYISPDKNFKLFMGGYLQEDFMHFENAPQLQGNIHYRAGVIQVGLNMYDKWQYVVAYDTSTGRFFNFALNYIGNPNFQASIGQFAPIVGLENNTTTPYLTFFELSLPEIVFTLNFVTGVGLAFYGESVALFGTVFRPAIGKTIKGQTPMGATATLTFSPVHTNTRALHFGLSDYWQNTDSRHVLIVSPQPEMIARNFGALIGARPLYGVKNFNILGAAAMTVYGPFSLQSEFFLSAINRAINLPSPHYAGYYVSANYFLTGESRIYSFKNAGFVGITQIRHKYGAWQIALRYSQLNLMNRTVYGGREHNFTIGLRWYLNPTFSCVFNYIRAIANPNTQGLYQKANLYGLRLQIVF